MLNHFKMPFNLKCRHFYDIFFVDLKCAFNWPSTKINQNTNQNDGLSEFDMTLWD